MANFVHRSHSEAKAWSPLAVVLAMTAGMMALVGLFPLHHLVIASA